MNAIILFKTKSGNRYFYDAKMNRVVLCHPLFYHMVNLHKDGCDMHRWYERARGQDIAIEKEGAFSARDIDYYYNKFLLFKDNGYFSTIDIEHRLSGKITANGIKSTLANMRQVTFEVTDACNLKCEYCGYGKFYWDYDKRGNKNLNINTAKNVLNYLIKLWNLPLNRSHDRNMYISFYGGEPLLHMPFIKEIVEYVNSLKALHNRFTFTMTTNAVLLEQYMNFLVKHDFHLLVSLDGNKENNGYRVFKNGKPAYGHIIKNVTAIKNKYPNYFKKKINFNVVLHNKNSVSEVYSYFKKRFGKIPSIGELSNSGIKDSQKEEFWKTYRNVNESLYQSEDYTFITKDMFINLPDIRNITTFIHQYSGSVYRDYNDLTYPIENFKSIPTGTCFPFSKKVYVTVNGKILPCERIGHQYALGYADERNIDIDFEKIAQTYNGYFDKMRKQCHACFNTKACTQCIYNLNIDDKNPECNGLMDYNDFSNLLSSCMYYLEKDPATYSRIMKEVTVE